MSKINIVIIGAGNIANEHLKSLCSIKNVNLYGIYSRTKKKSLDLATKYKINYCFSSLNEINDYADFINIFMVLVNPDQILNIFNKIKVYKKFIFFEKPLGKNYFESLKITQDVRKYELKTFVGLNRRYFSVINNGIQMLLKKNAKIRSIIIEGHERIWLIKKIKKHQKYINYWPYINSIHTVDLIRLFSGEINYKKFLSLRNKNSHMALMNSYSGIQITYISNFDYFDNWSFKIYNDNGDYIKMKSLEEGEFITKKKIQPIKKSKYDILFKTGFRNMHLNMLKSFKENKILWPNQSAKDNLKSILLLKKIFY